MNRKNTKKKRNNRKGNKIVTKRKNIRKRKNTRKRSMKGGMFARLFGQKSKKGNGNGKGKEKEGQVEFVSRVPMPNTGYNNSLVEKMYRNNYIPEKKNIPWSNNPTGLPRGHNNPTGLPRGHNNITALFEEGVPVINPLYNLLEGEYSQVKLIAFDVDETLSFRGEKCLRGKTHGSGDRQGDSQYKHRNELIRLLKIIKDSGVKLYVITRCTPEGNIYRPDNNVYYHGEYKGQSIVKLMDGIFGADALEPPKVKPLGKETTQLYVDKGGIDWPLTKVYFLEELRKLEESRNEKDIQRNQVILFDDDNDNANKAQSCGFHAVTTKNGKKGAGVDKMTIPALREMFPKVAAVAAVAAVEEVEEVEEVAEVYPKTRPENLIKLKPKKKEQTVDLEKVSNIRTRIQQKIFESLTEAQIFKDKQDIPCVFLRETTQEVIETQKATNLEKLEGLKKEKAEFTLEDLKGTGIKFCIYPSKKNPGYVVCALIEGFGIPVQFDNGKYYTLERNEFDDFEKLATHVLEITLQAMFFTFQNKEEAKKTYKIALTREKTDELKNQGEFYVRKSTSATGCITVVVFNGTGTGTEVINKQVKPSQLQDILKTKKFKLETGGEEITLLLTNCKNEEV